MSDWGNALGLCRQDCRIRPYCQPKPAFAPSKLSPSACIADICSTASKDFGNAAKETEVLHRSREGGVSFLNVLDYFR